MIGGCLRQPASWEDMASRPRPTRFRRSNSFSSWESLQSVSTAGDVIRQAGYPLEEHTVTTSDGYVLQMERMPRRGDCSSHLNIAQSFVALTFVRRVISCVMVSARYSSLLLF